MMELRSDSIRVLLHPQGARIASCVVDGLETAFGAGPAERIMAGDIFAGAVCGRHAGRITNAQFPLDGAVVKLRANVGPHQLHGGDIGFHARRWDYLRDGNRITFSLMSNDGDEGFPGQLEATAAYELQGTELSLTLEARCTRPTVVNLTNHGYWNLAGSGSVLGHELMMPGGHVFPLNDLLLPLGEICDVTGTRWDFRQPRVIGEDYDNCILLDGVRGEMKHGLMLRDPASGRQLDVWTSENCMQFYTAIHWQPEMTGHLGPLQRSMALAIEPQNVADAPNHAGFPSSILRPGEIYRNRMAWRFS
ncbi:MAG: galactose mutarotase [Proteobacteria bacterium]|nr:galactose mutarotase [Pseudomonadota bacterium]